jgi:hypothetical protein
LDKPHPVDALRIKADAGWITGAPAIEEIVPRAEPEPPLCNCLCKADSGSFEHCYLPCPCPTPEPEPGDIAPLVPTQAWFRQHGNIDVQLWFQTPDDSPLHIEKRHYTEGSVTFTRLDGTPLDIVNNHPRPDGWAFYLRGDLPETESIVMTAKENWVTGAPEMNKAVIPNWIV